MSILTAAVGCSAVFAGLGGLVGVGVGFGVEAKRVRRRRALSLNLPAQVLDDPCLMEPLLALADCRSCHLPSLQRLARRCQQMVELRARIFEATPAAVEWDSVTAAAQLYASIRKYLREFYKASHIQLVPDSGAMMPVVTDYATAQETLLETVVGYQHAITMEVKKKREQFVAGL
jgi:hypothetical protein